MTDRSVAAEATYKSPVKVLYCIDSLIRGGTELQLIGLIDRLDRDRVQPHLLTIRPSDPQLALADCEWFEWEVPKLFGPAGFNAMRRLARLLRERRIDVVHTFFQDSTVLGGVAAFMAGVPIRIAALRDMGFWSTPGQHILMRLAYRTMTDFIANSDAIRAHFSRTFNIDARRIAVIHNGIELDALPFVDRSGPVRNIVFVGNMTRAVKRADLFIQAAATVAKRHPEIRWHIIGDGHLRRNLETLAEELQITRQLRFAGRVADVDAELAIMDIGVVCSDSEGLSNALLEYMSRGTVAIATSVGGNPQVIRNNETGLLVSPNDATSIAAAVSRLVENSKLRSELAKKARIMLETAFGWEMCLRDHMQVYRANLS
jgi:glycosyltransferase involved in cell wall biosynthesis